MSELPFVVDDTLVDPALTPQEQQLAEQVQARGASAGDLAAVALALGGAFVLYRRYMARRLRKEMEGKAPTQDELYKAISKVLRYYMPTWIATVTPALVSGYREGMKEAQAGNLPQAIVQETAYAYAGHLGEHIDEVSSRALVEGFNAQVNRKVAARAAMERVIDAYGVTPRTMKTLVGIWTTPNDPKTTVLSNRPVDNPIHNRIDTLIASALSRRAEDIATTESYASKNQAKQLVWMLAYQRGLLPRGTTKKWVTADDERVCPTCGPMHDKQVAIEEQFVVPGGIKVYAPALHPSCRCDIELVTNVRLVAMELTQEPELAVAKSAFGVVHKALGDDPFNRDKSGQFARKETRSRQVFREASPEDRARLQAVQDLLTNVAPQELSVTRPELGQLSVTELSVGPQLSVSSGLSVSGGKLNPLSMGDLSTGSIGLSSQELASVQLPPIDLVMANRPEVPLETQDQDVWVNTPNNRPIFGIFDPIFDGDDDDYSLLLADESVPFYTNYDAPRGRQDSLREGLSRYWSDRVLDDLPNLFVNHPDYDEEINMITIDANDQEISIDEEAFKSAWYESLGQRSHASSSYVPVVVMDYASSPGNEFPDAEQDFMMTRDLARYLHIDDHIETLTPVVGIADKLNSTTYDQDLTGVISNPGKWRITGGDPDPGWEEGFIDYLPYTMRYIEPEDLFPDWNKDL